MRFHPETERQVQRLVAGLAPYYEQAIRRGLSRVSGLLLGDDASLHPSVFGYDLTAVSDGPVQTPFEVPGLFICCAWSARCQFADPADDPNLLRLSVTRGNGAPYIGDTRQGVSLKLVGELDNWVALPIPWVVMPVDQTNIRVDAETLAGATRVAFGASGFVLYGVSAAR